MTRRVPVPDHARLLEPGGVADYADRFLAPAGAEGGATAEQWARAVFEDAPRPVRWFLMAGWRAGLGFRLGPRTSPGHVLGGRIVGRSDATVRLELRSALLVAQLVLGIAGPQRSFTTLVQYRNRLGRLIWPPVAVLHRRIVPYLLDRAGADPLHR